MMNSINQRIKITDVNNGKIPFNNYNNDMWQEDLIELKKNVNKIKIQNASFKHTFFNEQIKFLKHGEIEYCFSVYQIMNLLRVFPNAITNYVEDGQYWTISLDYLY